MAENYRGVSLTDLGYIVAVADELSFRKAAERCCATQPTLSIQIRKCERYLGIAIFDRNKHGVRITPIGAEVVSHARQALRAADAIRGLMRPGCIGPKASVI
jgi:LysR family hydrogen peroxide-inducible transcriptional activator